MSDARREAGSTGALMQGFSKGRHCRRLIGFVVALAMAAVPAAVLAQTDNAIPANWKGHITYRGSYRGQVTTPPKAPNFNGRLGSGGGGLNFNIPDLVGSLKGGNTQQIGGDYTAELEIDGSKVTLSSRTTGWLHAGSGSGTRHGDVCVFPQDHGEFRARCTKDVFEAEFSPDRGGTPRLEYTADASMTSIVDRAEQERQQAAARAEQARKDAQFAAYLKSRPRASKAMAAALGQAITQDSSAWYSNHYDSGSLNDVIVLKTSTDGTKTLRGNYTYNGGSSGWVQAKVSGSSVECLEYWDAGGTCSPTRTADARKTFENTPSPPGRDLMDIVHDRMCEKMFNPAHGRYECPDSF